MCTKHLGRNACGAGLSELASARAGRNYSGFRRLGKIIKNELTVWLESYVVAANVNHVLSVGDSELPDTPCAYGNPVMDSLLKALVPKIEYETQTKLYPTYSYFRIYKAGDILRRHRDRPSCETTVSLCIGYEASEPWPLWLEVDGCRQAVMLNPGEAALYRGSETYHWRDRFEGRYMVQAFLHYVNRQGPNREWIYDKRPALNDDAELTTNFKNLIL